MIKKALEYIVEMSAPFITEINGEKYADKPLDRVETEDYAGSIKLTTLSSLVEYIKSNVDEMKGKMLVHVASPTGVLLFSQLDKYRKRETVLFVEAGLPNISFDRFIGKESFNIALQSKFEDTEDKAHLLQYVGTIESGTLTEYGDDGISQKAVIKVGISNKKEAIVPNPVVLKPFRTFTEVEQPASSFIFRMKEDRCEGITCALFEADGGVWKREAMENVKAYLKEALKDVEGYTIIS